MNSGNDFILTISELEIGYFNQKKISSVFKNISLSVREGELIALIGRNGVGKSTLLKTIARINRFVNGEIQINNRPINQYTLKEWAKKISFVSTDPVYISNLTVRELVSLGRHPYTNWMFSLSEKDRNIINKSINTVRINDLEFKNIDEISDGERQRALIARTLAQNTDIIILDEPTAYLDLPNRFEIIYLLHELSKNKQKTIIFSSHDLNLAISLADKIWLMEGASIFEGAPEDLVLNGTFEHIFDNSLINFDKITGQIKLIRESIDEIYVSGSGNAYIWTKKAVERLNFNISKNSNSLIKVYITEKQKKLIWELEINGKKFVYNNIYELNLHLNQIKIFKNEQC